MPGLHGKSISVGIGDGIPSGSKSCSDDALNCKGTHGKGLPHSATFPLASVQNADLHKASNHPSNYAKDRVSDVDS